MHKNNQLTELITELRKTSAIQQAPVWSAVADDLARPTRQKAIVNLAKLARSTKQGEVIIVPGKVLGDGELSHSLTIAALGFSASAQLKLKANKTIMITITDALKKDPKGKSVRILA